MTRHVRTFIAFMLLFLIVTASGARAAGKFDWKCIRGDVFRRTVTWTDASNNPIDVTGCTVKMYLRTSYTVGAKTYYTFDSTAGTITLTDPTHGVITVYGSPATTSGFTFGTAVATLVYTFPSGDVKTLLYGDFNTYDNAKETGNISLPEAIVNVTGDNVSIATIGIQGPPGSGGGGGGTPGGTSGQVQYNNAGAFGGFTASGDATINTATGAVSVTKTGGVAFSPSATVDTTNGSNVVSGTVADARLSTNVPLKNVVNAFTSTNTFPTQTAADNSTKAATTAYADGAVATGVATAEAVAANASNLTSGTVAAARLPATVVQGAQSAAAHNFVTGFNASGAELTAQPAASDVTGLAASATTDTTNASNISSGTLGAARLPATAVQTNQSNTFTTGTQDLTSAAKLLIPLLGSDPTSAPGAIWFNGAAFKFWDNTAITPVKHTLADLDSAQTFTNKSIASSEVTGLAASATTDTTNAANITSGTLPAGRLPAFTGDVTTSAGTAATTIANSAVTNAKMANMAAHSVKGNNTGSAAAPIDETTTQLTADLNVFTSSLQGLVPPSGGGTTGFLRADGTFAAPAGGGDVATTSNNTYSGTHTQDISASGQSLKIPTKTDPGSPLTSEVWLSGSTGTLMKFRDNAGSPATHTMVDLDSSQTLTNKSISSGQITGLAASATTDTTNATNITSGTLPTAQLPTIPTNKGGLNTTTNPSSAQMPIAQSGTAYAPTTIGGDATITTGGSLTVTKTNGSAFATSATTDTTNASNISSGSLALARITAAADNNEILSQLSGVPAYQYGLMGQQTLTASAPALTKASPSYNLIDPTSNTVSPTLPQVSTCAGKIFWFKVLNATNAVTITPFSGDTIEAASSISPVPLQIPGIISDGGTHWRYLKPMIESEASGGFGVSLSGNAAGGALYQATTLSVGSTAAGNSGAPLTSGGAGAPAFAALNLAGGSNIVTGILPLANHPAGNANQSLAGTGPAYADSWLGASAQTANVTLTGSSSALQVLDGTSAVVTATLPAASSNAGQILWFKCINSAHAISVARAGSDTIDGATSVAMVQYDILGLESDGTSTWRVVKPVVTAGTNVTLTKGNGLLQIAASGGGGGLTNGGAKSTNFTAAVSNYYQVTGTATCTLPTAVGNDALMIGVQVQSGGTVTFNTTSSQTIVSATNHASGGIVDSGVGNQWWFISDGANWDLQVMNVGI